ncbi:hypothetical protein [Deinococcus sp.]|uniref:hypothetical protein n=1 Tax=Deinococcus sp. TaxID=47478 RepID=UPI003CC64609
MTSDSDFQPLSLNLFQGAGPLDPKLLIAARQHVGSAGIEQVAALERLIAAGQEHVGLAQAAQQVVRLLKEQSQASQAVRQLLLESEQQVLYLEQLASIVTTALQQITATPVQRISAEVLQDIASRMHRQLGALNQLIASVRESLALPAAATPDLEAIQLTLQTELERIAQGERQGHLATLVQLAQKACSDIAAQREVADQDRVAALQEVLTWVQQLVTSG